MKVVCLVFIALFGTAAALQCYHCNSVVTPECSDNFHDQPTGLTDVLLVTCPTVEGGEEPHCRKQKSYIDGPDGQEVRVDRDCGQVWRNMSEGVNCYHKTAHDYHTETCQCRGDSCNGGRQMGGTALLIMLAGATVLLFEGQRRG